VEVVSRSSYLLAKGGKTSGKNVDAERLPDRIRKRDCRKNDSLVMCQRDTKLILCIGAGEQKEKIGESKGRWDARNKNSGYYCSIGYLKTQSWRKDRVVGNGKTSTFTEHEWGSTGPSACVSRNGTPSPPLLVKSRSGGRKLSEKGEKRRKKTGTRSLVGKKKLPAMVLEGTITFGQNIAD